MAALTELDVLIVDCQTTGASPAHGVVLELGWGVARAGDAAVHDLQSHWVELPAGHRVSNQVRKLTGYDATAASAALPAEEVWRRFRATVGANAAVVPAAIHFARFELSFLRDWAERYEPGAPFPLDAICVHAAACRLYPDLPRRTLRALAGHLGHGLHLERRSLGHVEATAFVWKKLAQELAGRGVHTWSELQEWLAKPAARPASAGKKPRFPIAPSEYRSLPDSPGVYHFLRSNGDVLYVGKATSLRKRTASHFASRTRTEHTLEMLTQVSRIRAAPTASPLEAALLENESIKTLRPPYNLQLVVPDPRIWYADRDFRHATETPDDSHRFGPLPSGYSLSSLSALIALLSGEEASRWIRARAIGASELWTPEPEVFAAGFEEFRVRHLTLPQSVEAPRRAVLAAARRLLLTAPFAKSADEEEEEEPSDAWDPERVTRHLERAAAQAYQLLRRARWLALLHDSAVVYREPADERARRLLVSDGRIVRASDHVDDEALELPPARAGVPTFDRAKYDTLRVLTSELKRVRRDGGSVTLYLPSSRRIGGPLLEGSLRLV